MKISVCIPTYNGGKYIKMQIESILCQLSPTDEIIISDDGSTDDTIMRIKEFNDVRIRIFEHEKTKQRFLFGYTAKNLENALSKASGNIIFLADQDDVWLPGKVEHVTKELETSDAILTDCNIVDENLKELVYSKITSEKVKISDLRNIYTCGYLGCCIAFRRNLLEHILPIPKNTPHDLWIGLVCNNFGSFKILQEPLLLYRRHSSNVSSPNRSLTKKNNIDINKLWYKIGYRLFIIKPYVRLLIFKYLK